MRSWVKILTKGVQRIAVMLLPGLVINVAPYAFLIQSLGFNFVSNPVTRELTFPNPYTQKSRGRHLGREH